MTELKEIEKVYNKFWGINLHKNRRGGSRFTGIGGGIIVIGRWGATRKRAFNYFIKQLKEAKDD